MRLGKGKFIYIRCMIRACVSVATTRRRRERGSREGCGPVSASKDGIVQGCECVTTTTWHNNHSLSVLLLMMAMTMTMMTTADDVAQSSAEVV